MDQELFRNPGVQIYEWAGQRCDGKKREVVITKATFPKADSTVGGLIGGQTDVTEFKEAQRELRELAARLAEVEETERQHLARELHDEVGQGLTALGLTLTLLKTQMPQETATSLLNRSADAVTLVEKTGETIRNVMAELRPRYRMTTVCCQPCVGMELNSPGGQGPAWMSKVRRRPRLARPVELALFRIAQEALTNVVKYARASGTVRNLWQSGSHGCPARVENYVQALKMWFSISVYSPAKEYFVVVFDVITERKQMEEKLRSAAHKWQTTFNAISDAVCLLDGDSLILQCNRAMADLTARPVSEIIGRPCWEVLPLTSESTPGYPLGCKLESNRRATQTLPFDDGSLHVMADPIMNEAGEVAGRVLIIADISQYKRAEAKVRDLNILLGAIKDINEALLRVKSERELFQKTCDLVKHVPYVRFTWIGLVQPDSFEVKPVAWAGHEEGYLSEIKVTWDDSPTGQGPTGMAIKTGHLVNSLRMFQPPS